MSKIRGNAAIVGTAESDLGAVAPEMSPVDLMAQGTVRALDALERLRLYILLERLVQLVGRRSAYARLLVHLVVRSLDAHDLEEGLAGLREVGSLRKMAGREIDEVPGQQPSFDKDANTKTVAFKFDAGHDGVEGAGEPPVGLRPRHRRPLAAHQHPPSRRPRPMATTCQSAVCATTGASARALSRAATWRCVQSARSVCSRHAARSVARSRIPSRRCPRCSTRRS